MFRRGGCWWRVVVVVVFALVALFVAMALFLLRALLALLVPGWEGELEGLMFADLPLFAMVLSR